MKKLLISLVAILGLATPALAQNSFGVRLGYPGIGVQYTAPNALSQNLGFRVQLNVSPFFGVFGILPEADILYTLPIASVPGLSAYFGGGPAISVALGAVTGFGFGLGFVAGIDYLITPTISAFVELNPRFIFGDVLFFGGFGFGGAVGANFRI